MSRGYSLRCGGSGLGARSEVLAEINYVVWHVVRETDPTVVTDHRLCLLAMCTHDWWALHPHRSKNHLSAADVMSLVGKGLGLVVVGQLLGLLVCVKMLPHVAVVAMAVDASIITSIANVPAVVMACVGLYLLAFDLHFALPVCAALSLAYWCSALFVGWSLSLIVGGGLVTVAVAMRWSWLLFPEERIKITVIYDSKEKIMRVLPTDTTQDRLQEIASVWGLLPNSVNLVELGEGDSSNFVMMSDEHFSVGRRYALELIPTRPGTFALLSILPSSLCYLCYRISGPGFTSPCGLRHLRCCFIHFYEHIVLLLSFHSKTCDVSSYIPVHCYHPQSRVC